MHEYPRLTEESLAVAVRKLVARDEFLGALTAAYGIPPLWERREGFATLVLIILEQQVSLASAAAIYRRLESTCDGDVSPRVIIDRGVAGLLASGITRQKTRYITDLAHRVEEGGLALSELTSLADDEVERQLTAVPGIGPWTARIYLLMALCRPDVWPAGDLALHRAMEPLLRDDEEAVAVAAARIAEGWRPLRAVAARILWHAYLERRRMGVGA